MVILLAIIAAHAYFKLDGKKPDHRLFLLLIQLTLLILVLEVFSVALNSGDYIELIAVHRLVDTLGFTLSPLVPICAALYVYKRTNRYGKVKRIIPWLAVPFVINGIISLGSYSFNWIFSITPENVYVRGPLFFVSPLTFYTYYLGNLTVLFTSRRQLGREELLMLSLLTIIPAVMSVFQLYYFIYLTIWNSTALAVIINYIFIVHSLIKIDPLTGLGNRVAYNEYIDGLRGRSNIVLAVVNIDLDDFKSINDLYGHHEGDKVLRFFAGQLEAVFGGKGVPIRFGGDEFIVLINENQQEVVEQYIKKLVDRVAAYNATSARPYLVKFSYGMTIFNAMYDSIDALIRHSDALMYAKKAGKN